MGRHSNRYIYHYDTIYTLEDMKDYFGEGWSDLLEKAFRWVSKFPTGQICSAKRCYGMLHMYARAEDDEELEAIEGLLWKIERISTQVCEMCGEFGKRRKELKTMYCLCNKCYFDHLNKYEDPMSLFREGQEGRF